jgi:hypothetical protein
LAAADFGDFEPGIAPPAAEELVHCPHFVVAKWSLDRPRPASERAAFSLFFCIDGSVAVNGLQFKAGEFFLIPACASGSILKPVATGTSVLRITLPPR